jgi:hypothetical protein
VSCTLNSTTVTGTGTGFVANARVGDAFLGPDGRWYEVANIASDTVLSILPAYQGATVSAGTYALAPMQGYVKDSADQLRALVNKFGTLAASASINSLAALTGAANKIAYFTAADQMALADFPAQGVKLVGTVSQSGGMPTGAIIETGSNANGTYTKWADGTMICERASTISTTISQSLPSGVYYNPSTGVLGPQTMPATFISVPKISMYLTATGDSTGWIGGSTSPTTSSWPIAFLLEAFGRATAQVYTVHQIAKGRWF